LSRYSNVLSGAAQVLTRCPENLSGLTQVLRCGQCDLRGAAQRLIRALQTLCRVHRGLRGGSRDLVGRLPVLNRAGQKLLGAEVKKTAAVAV
jgi:hypothetical protein